MKEIGTKLKQEDSSEQPPSYGSCSAELEKLTLLTKFKESLGKVSFKAMCHLQCIPGCGIKND